ncbi:MAG: hypothetical protein AMXMBFR36_18980 [Acidobacteriota bacterium]
MTRRIFAIAVTLLGLPALVAAAAPKRLINVDRDGVAVDGYDVVAYFTEQAPVPGRPDLTSVHDGATYRFASAEHKAMFDAAPAKYVPAFGGFCAYAVSRKALRPIDPAIFHFVDGRLFLQHTKKAFDLFERDEAGNTKKADANWPRLVEKKADKYRAGQFDEPVK